MDKPKQKPKDDLVQQRYKGPSAVTAGLGEGVLQTKALLVSGLIIGGGAAALFPSKVKPLIGKFDALLKDAAASPNQFKNALGGAGSWFMEMPRGVVKWLRKFPGLDEKITKYKVKNVEAIFDGAIVTSTILSFLGPLVGTGTGYLSARAGRNQFNDAKSEISTLRTKLIETQTELEDTKTAALARQGTLKVAGDEPPPITEPEEKAPGAPKPSNSWAEKATAEKAQPSELSL